MGCMLDEVIDVILTFLGVVKVMRLNRKVLGRCRLRYLGVNTTMFATHF